MSNKYININRFLSSLLVLMAAPMVTITADAALNGKDIVDAAGIKGGIIVHLGCGDGKLTAELRVNDKYVVHGLDTSVENVEKARATVADQGLYGPVSISGFTGACLPYSDNMVNLLVVDDQNTKVTAEEIIRTLAPRGTVVFRKNSPLIRNLTPSSDSPLSEEWTIYRKPVPQNTDEWTHWLHGPDGNAVAHDQAVGPPRRMQWTAGPIWSRHHNLMPSVSAMVSAGGRIFYIADEAPPGMTGNSPDKWVLTARDAFNGVELWRHPIDDWGWKAWSWCWEGRFNQPNQIAKRIVAVGDKLYAALGFNAPLSMLDAATGKVLKTYKGTEYTDEILYLDGILLLSINNEAQRSAKPLKDPQTGKDVFSLENDPPVKKSVAAIDAVTGKILWRTGQFTGNSTKTGGLERITHILLAARGKRVYMLDRDRVAALDLKSGKKLWEADRPKSDRYTSRYYHLMSDMCTLVATDDAVLLCQLEPIQKRIGWRVIKARVRAYSPDTGKELWTKQCGNWGHFCVPDVFVTGGLAWVHDSSDMVMLGLDLKNGEEKKRISTEAAFDNGHHHRCHRNKATDKYLMTSFRGFEFFDWSGKHADLNHWVRGACRFGGMPCNGLLYTTPHPCDCYVDAKLNGIAALAPASENRGFTPVQDNKRLLKGPAYGRITFAESTKPEWPTYRHDPERSGHTASDISADLKISWTTKLNGRLSAPIAGGGRVYLASTDTHEIHALDAETGKINWSRTVDGQVDTPPTLHKGLLLCGTRNGWVYALRANDGEIAWQFLAAPEQRLVGAFSHLESAWPVNGSVLVKDDSAYFVAGRSSFLDNGITAWSLDPMTGKVLKKQLLADKQSVKVDTGRDVKKDYGVVVDILTGSETGVYMRHRRLFGDDDGKVGWGARLGSTAGMLDSSWFNRTYWILDGKLHGETLVHDDDTAYSVRAYSNRGHGGFVEAGAADYKLAASNRKHSDSKESKERGKAKTWPAPNQDIWTREISPRIRAMAVAGKTLLCVGTPDRLDPKDPWAYYEGRRGGILLAVSAADGKTIQELEFDGGPVRDGIAVVNGRVYITTMDERLHCFE